MTDCSANCCAHVTFLTFFYHFKYQLSYFTLTRASALQA